MYKAILLAAICLWPSVGLAQTQAAATVRISIETTAGPIVLDLEADRAPLTTANFLAYVDQHRLDGTVFYRAMTRGADSGLIQGGVGSDPDRVLPPVAHEPTTQTGISHTDGVISLARFAPGSATANFFIIVGDMSFLDAGRATSGDTEGFAAFGHVVEGMDIVRSILHMPVSPTEGVGVMKGQMLDPQVRILKVHRVK